MSTALGRGRLGPIAALALASSGCMFWIVGTEIESGATLPAKSVAAIRPGTPAREVVERLGPPTAVARPGQTLQLPTFHLRKEGSRELASAELFARFVARGATVGPADFLYFYEAVRTSRPGHYTAGMIGGQGGAGRGKIGTDRVRTERLLLLVDGEGRTVRDAIHEVEPPPREAPSPEEAGT